VANWSVNRLNWARDLIDAKHYLEIGVFKGQTFNSFECAFKDAVDPNFQFDTKAFARPRTRFFEVPSDTFFMSDAMKGRRPYDLCFLDGLHTFEQILRDFLGTLPLTHENSIILIDDTVPSDMFSAQKQGVAAKMRRLSGVEGNAWHGDVYKVVYFIHDFCPSLSFATILRPGNPQTLVWRQPRENFEPVFNDVEKISRLSFPEMDAMRDVMNIMPEREAMDLVEQAFAERAKKSKT